MSSLRDLLSSARSHITEVSPTEAAEMLQHPGTVALDVREAEEYDQGALKGAVHIPRGFLEMQVAGRIPNRAAPIVVYCAAGVRSAFASDTLVQLGYTNVVNMVGGFNRWKDEGLAWEVPTSLSQDQRNRYQRHLLLPEVDVEGQVKLLASKALLIGAWVRRQRSTWPQPASARWASSTWTSWTAPTCSARSCTTWTASASGRWSPPRGR
jgi:rhodanese-related sulfurtransferase